jgi:hypothetical protein
MISFVTHEVVVSVPAWWPQLDRQEEVRREHEIVDPPDDTDEPGVPD